MEGRPWLRILLVLAGFTLAGWPVWNVTHSAAVVAPAAPAVPSPAAGQPFLVELTFATAPVSFELDYLGAPLLTGGGPGRNFSTTWKVAVPKEGVDLFLDAKWPEGTGTTAVRVQLTRGDNAPAVQTLWADGELAETITVREPQP